VELLVTRVGYPAPAATTRRNAWPLPGFWGTGYEPVTLRPSVSYEDPRLYLSPLFTEVRGRGILRSSA
jgi:hypothetical protein